MSALLNSNEAALRAFIARVVGWANTSAIDHALRSIHLSVTHHAALVLLGGSDLVSVARRIHVETLGKGRPFVVCERRRYASGTAAAQAARGGSLCVPRARLPRDSPTLAELLRDPLAATQLMVCAEAHHHTHPFLFRPAPLRIPALSTRTSELPRIVDEFAHDAVVSLGATATGFTHIDREWLIAHSSATLSEVEKGTRRLVAIRQTSSISRAAALLGMSHVSLSQWLERRRFAGRNRPARRGRWTS